MKWLKRRKGLSLVHLIVYVLMIILFMSFNLVVNSNSMVQSVSNDTLKSNCYAVDRALSIWYGSHSGQYPPNLAYLTDIGILPPTIEINNFGYSTTGEKYRLTIRLSDGSTYISPLSNL